MSWATAVTLVDFNAINNPSGKTQPYTNYSSTDSTTVLIGNNYNLTVNLNTDGNYTIYSKAWVDWNQDVDFDDSGEEYDLGSAINTVDGITTLSPLSITIPSTALLGKTVMRVSAKFGVNPDSCETGFDGEVEDYAIIVTTTVGVTESDLEMKPVIYPNPTDGNFSINLVHQTESVKVTITDIVGQLLQTKTYNNQQNLNLKLNEPAGIYLLIIEANDEQEVIRLIKE
jgi:hypothetical protein